MRFLAKHLPPSIASSFLLLLLVFPLFSKELLQPRRNTVFIYSQRATDRILSGSTTQYNTGESHVTVKTDQGLLDIVCICIKHGKPNLTHCYDPGDGSHLFIGNQAAGQARGHHGSQVTNQQGVT